MKNTLLKTILAAVMATAFISSAHAQIYGTSGGSLQEIDPTTGDVIASTSIPNGDDAQSVAVSGSTVYVASSSPDNTQIIISSYDLSLNSINSDVATVASTVSQDGGGLAGPNSLTVVGSTLYFNNSSYNTGNITAVNLTDGTSSTIVSIANQGDNFNNIAVDPANNTIYGGRFQASTLDTFNATTGDELGSIYLFGGGNDEPGNIAISPDGSTVYVEDYNAGTILTFDAATGALINGNFITYFPDDTVVAGWSGLGFMALDGNNLYVEDNNTGLLSDYDATTGAFVGVVANNDGLNDVAIINSTYVGTPGGTYGGGTPGVGGYGGTLGDSGENQENPGVGSAPEPRSWALAGIIALGFLGMYRRQTKQSVGGMLA